MIPSGLSAADTLRHMINGFWISQALYVAATLRLADLLRDGPKTANELAKLSGAHGSSLYRLLRALASIGVFAEDSEGRFELTPLAQHLRTDVPISHAAWAIWSGHRPTWAMWGELLHCIRTGEAGFPKIHGMPVWEFNSRHPEHDAIFNAAMTGTSRPQAELLAGAYDFSSIDTLVDVGGGHGVLLAAILQGNPAMRGILFDQAHVTSGAKAVLEAAGVASRCEITSGDFFEAVPLRAAAYVLKFILHDWDDAQAEAILRNCRSAMRPHGRILAIERVIPPGNDFHPSKLGDLQMLVLYGGRERTAEEFRELYARVGLRLTAVIGTSVAGLSIIEGVGSN
jgi:predicted O-methyltransferase YrrM